MFVWQRSGCAAGGLAVRRAADVLSGGGKSSEGSEGSECSGGGGSVVQWYSIQLCISSCSNSLNTQQLLLCLCTSRAG